MKAVVNKLITQSFSCYVERANCFNAVQLYWNDSVIQKFVGAADFVEYIVKHFSRLPSDESSSMIDVSIVRSRRSRALPIGQIVFH